MNEVAKSARSPFLLAALLAVAVSGTATAQEVCTADNEKQAREQVALLSDMDGDPWVRFTPTEVFLQSDMWEFMDYVQKRGLTAQLAVYHNCIWKPANVKDSKDRPVKKQDSWVVTVLDKDTGKKLGTLGLLGFKVHS